MRLCCDRIKKKERKGKRMADGTKKEQLHEDKKEVLFCMPKNVRQIGQPEENRKIYIEDYVMSFIRYLGKESTNTYKTAVFLGEYKDWEGKQCIFIQGAIEVEGIDLEEGKCFPKEIWEGIYQSIEENFKNGSIVGWMLTKAGIPLEATEILEKIHVDNFSGQDKTLMLYDTLEREECFFVFEKKHLKKKEGYYIYYEKNQEMQNYMLKKKGIMPSEKVDDYVIKEMKKRMAGMEEAKRKKKQARKRLRIASILGAAVLLGFLWQNREVLKKLARTEETFSENKKVEKHKEEDELIVEQQESKITISNEKVDEPVETAEKKKETPKTQEVMQNKVTQKEEIEEEGQYYIIQPGDTMVSICMKQFHSLEKMDDILKLNNIEDKDKIVAGQRIKLWE